MVLTKEDSMYILRKFTNGKAEFINFKMCSLSTKVLGFLGEHHRLEIHYRQNEKYRKVCFFVKTLPTSSKKLMEYIENSSMFTKEILFYNNLLRKFQTYFEEAFAPVMYLSKSQKCIVLEDLYHLGYATACDQFNMEYCSTLMKTLARFHASSIIFENKTGCSIKDSFQEELKEANFSDARKEWAASTLQAVINCIKMMPEFSQNEKIVEKLNFFCECIPMYIKPSKSFENVISHDDLWRNNIMFRRNAKNKLECILVDFQFVRYTPPAIDLLLSLYLNTSASFLKENIDDLLYIYYKNFCNNLKLYNINPDSVLTEKELLQSVQFYKPIALVEAAFFGTAVFVDANLSQQVLTNEEMFENFTYKNRSKYACQQFKENESYRNSLSAILRQLLECFQNFNLEKA